MIKRTSGLGRSSYIAPAGMSAEPIRSEIEELLHNLIIYIMTFIRATQTSLLDASIIYGVRMASEIEEDCFSIEELRAVISAAVRVRSARIASTSNCAIRPYLHSIVSQHPVQSHRTLPPRVSSGRAWEPD